MLVREKRWFWIASSKVGSMRVLGGRIVLVEGRKGSLERDPQVMCKNNMLVAGRVLRQACSLTILPIDRDIIRTTALTSRSGGPRRVKSDNRCCRRAARRARFHLGGTSSAGGTRGSGEVSSRAEMLMHGSSFGAISRDHRSRGH